MDVKIDVEIPLLERNHVRTSNNNDQPFRSFYEKYYWEDIHKAARLAHPEHLQDVIDHLETPELKNSLTVFSENALHILFEYGNQSTVCTAQISNGDAIRTCNIIPNEQPNILECAKILIESEVNIDHNNFWNETPLLIAIKYRYLETIRYLLEQSYKSSLDLDTCRDPHTKKSARELLKELSLDIEVTSNENSATRRIGQLLFTFLKSNDEESFLKQNIRLYVNYFDGGVKKYSSGTMLMLCFRKAFFEFKRFDADNNNNISEDIYETAMLTNFCSKGMVKAICFLLDNRADFRELNRTLKYNLLETVTSRCFYPLLVLLLHHKRNKIRIEEILKLIRLLPSQEIPYRNHTLSVLLGKLEQVKGRSDISPNGTEVLTDLLPTISDNDDLYSKCIKLGASLAREDIMETAKQNIIEDYLDDVIDGDFVHYDGLVLDSNNVYSETDATYAICVDHKKRELLLHPAMICFVHHKWRKMRYYFYATIAFYGALWATLFYYMFCLLNNKTNTVCLVILAILIFVDLCKEIMELIFYRSKYFTDKSNYIEMALISGSAISLIFQNKIAVVVAMLSVSINVVIILGQLPSLTKYMIIFGTSKYFFEYAFFYCIQFLSFAVCFAVIHSSETNEKGAANIFTWLFNTLIFFTGEFNDEVLESKTFPVFGRILLIIFIFCMTIILNNLLVGLIVTDMDKLHKEGKLYKQVKIVKFFKKMNLILNRVNNTIPISFLKNNTTVFHRGQRKTFNLNHCPSNIFDEEDWSRIVQAREKKIEKSKEKLLLDTLYEHIIAKASNNETESIKKNKKLVEKVDAIEIKLQTMFKHITGREFNMEHELK